MRKLLRRWLSIDKIEKHLYLQRLTLDNIETNIRRLNTSISVSNSALGQIVAKLAPLLAVPEDDPSRVAASKELGEKVIQKLEEEAQVLEHYSYTPKGEF